MNKPSSVAVLPFPLTAAALFGYGILRFLGHIDEKTHTRFTRVSGSRANLFGCQERIINLHCGEFYPKVFGLIKSDAQLKRILYFAVCGDNHQNRTRHVRLVAALQKLNTDTSRRALTEVFLLVRMLKEKSDDIWKSEKILENFTIMLESLEVQPVVTTYPPDKRIISLPVFQKKDGIPTDDDVTGSFEVTLSEGRAYELQDKHICLVVGGPSGSGKSTLSVSLVAEMENCIRSLKSRTSFSDLQLTVGLANLDLATPTTQAIAEGWATDREKVKNLKQPWTMELAEQAQQELLRSRAQHNIVIGDLPGRVTDVTELLAGTADASIIITKDWTVLQKEWNPFMSSVGLPIVSRIRSRRSDETGFSSLVTHRRPQQRLSGRITALNRYHKSWDLFIQWLAVFLLFEILPTQFEAGS
ncbi:hypothetical protein A2917_01595 [Candidatus Nomurabacteria bacterium RIFCSPLOWO2_01_FULL_42_17]|uniref:Uncharacterized protein n=1 Tax=Candidatus Nomurabacteria bacterium RIFCSPLOWO2_01_FULL_42_17 TaxID=1801780 RepID=A0A1F6XLS2_9BACT|nr:MAG: hypothetical protein A2917_01595 [Candidatus Nomurabacteria bacterium RIFCSPLOWO2_01_FULL_42_17]